MEIHENEYSGFILNDPDNLRGLSFYLENYPKIEIRFILDHLFDQFKFKTEDKMRSLDELNFIWNALYIIDDFIQDLILSDTKKEGNLESILENFSKFVTRSKLLNYLLKYSKDDLEDNRSLQIWISRLINQIRMIYTLLHSNFNIGDFI